MKEYTIGVNDAGQRLDRFLTKRGFTIGVIMKALRNKDISLNGDKRVQAAHRLEEGGVLRIYANRAAGNDIAREINLDEISPDVNIVYEDANILLLDKPAGLLAHADDGGERDTLINRAKAYLYRKGEFVPQKENGFEPSLCHRIDRNTCGIVTAAKNAEALRIMNAKIKNRELKKLYLCLLTRVPEASAATLTAYLEKDEKTNTVRVTDKKTAGNKTIVTEYRVIAVSADKSLALTEVELVTGRTHQIRAHMAYIGCPLLGDGKYGSNRVNKAYGVYRQALCAYRVGFAFKGGAGILDYLNGKNFEVEKDKIWFLGRFYNGNYRGK